MTFGFEFSFWEEIELLKYIFENKFKIVNALGECTLNKNDLNNNTYF